jgi:transposase InsO family protein
VREVRHVDPARPTAYQIKAARFPSYKDLAGFDFAASEVNEAWRVDDNTRRPHTSLGGLTPDAFATRSRQDQSQNRVR